MVLAQFVPWLTVIIYLIFDTHTNRINISFVSVEYLFACGIADIPQFTGSVDAASHVRVIVRRQGQSANVAIVGIELLQSFIRLQVPKNSEKKIIESREGHTFLRCEFLAVEQNQSSDDSYTFISPDPVIRVVSFRKRQHERNPS